VAQTLHSTASSTCCRSEQKKPTLRTPATFYPHKIKLDDLSVDLTANVVEKKLQEDGFLAV
jgi:hypothetical protein